MKKVVITGGLGYIGTELCKIYSGEARFKKILVIDNRFISERVKQLREWGIDFVQADILDQNAMKSLLSDADTIIHLAGITDVAYVKTESNSEQDKKITEVGIEGTRNIINFSRSDCKILFPSTHVVFEGFQETKLNIKEEEKVNPVLTYAKGKAQSEEDLEKSGKNYVILRLASVCGYSTDTMRINIMPNLFSKIASQNGTIKMFSGGVQLKSLVPLIDVARCFKFMEDNEQITKEIFHCSKESMTVKEVAELCKKYNPKLKLESTKDEIPNLGYTIDSSKLLSTGFKFLYSVEESIKQMIENWSPRNINPSLEFFDRGGKNFVDNRGKIVNYELTEPINLIGYIESKKGSVRANHYHPIQEQKCLLIKGQYISVIKDLSEPDAPIKTHLVNAGDLSTIKPNVAHTMVFTEDSIFLNLVRGEREHENYGITHTMPYVLVDEKFRDELLKNYKTSCRGCGSSSLKTVISLGQSPLANNLLDSAEEETKKYPLEVNYCSECHNCQLSYVVPSSEMFDNYLYLSSTSKDFREHFEKAANKYIKLFSLDESSKILDIGSNDGIGLKPFLNNGIKTVVGVEPAKNVCKIANDSGIYTINSYFDDKVVDQINKEHGKFDLVTASNVFAHSDNLKNIAENVFKLLKDDGCFVVEVQYLLDTIKDLTFDNIYHEHVNYWCVTSLTNFISALGYKIVDVEHINTHGGSIRAYIKKDGNICDNVQKFLDDEKTFGLLEYKTYEEFARRVEEIKDNVKNNFINLKKSGFRIAGYGSPAKATTSLNYFGIDSKYIDYIIEDNQLKNNKFIPGVTIPIKNKQFHLNNDSNAIVVMAWNFFEYIKKNNKDLIDSSDLFISIKDLQNKEFIK